MWSVQVADSHDNAHVWSAHRSSTRQPQAPLGIAGDSLDIGLGPLRLSMHQRTCGRANSSRKSGRKGEAIIDRKVRPQNLLRERIYVESYHRNTEIRERETGERQPRTTSGTIFEREVWN